MTRKHHEWTATLDKELALVLEQAHYAIGSIKPPKELKRELVAVFNLIARARDLQRKIEDRYV